MIGAAIVFLVSLETRGKRRRVTEALNRLRSVAHVIDAHQLTKEPWASNGLPSTAHSPKRALEPPMLARYLDYCSELLSLSSKLGFLYVQSFPDTEGAANLEQLRIAPGPGLPDHRPLPMAKNRRLVLALVVGLLLAATIARGIDRRADPGAISRAAIVEFGHEPAAWRIANVDRTTSSLRTVNRTTFDLPKSGTCEIEVRRSLPFTPWQVSNFELHP